MVNSTDHATQDAWWSLSPDELLRSLRSRAEGLTTAEANDATRRDAGAGLQPHPHVAVLRLFLGQFKSPLVLILIIASIISIAAGEWIDAAVVLAIVLGSTVLGFVQEYAAGNAIEKLRSQITINSTVLRDGSAQSIPSTQVVSGDVVLLSAGSLIPGDGMVIEANDCFVNQAVLTGETFPVEKAPGAVDARAGLSERTNAVFKGTSVSSGSARVLIAKVGKSTAFGQIAERLVLRPPMTEFERGIQHFGYLLTRIMLVMVVVVLAANMLTAKPAVSSLLFALALAVGLTPELLPAILSITLSHGAKRMAKRGVIVRRLNAIENLGSMDVLCSDKTGTLTSGVIGLDAAVDLSGQASTSVLHAAGLNARLQSGLPNPLDDALLEAVKAAGLDLGTVTKIDEIPFDFVRARLSVVVGEPGGERRLITKGALAKLLAVCTSARDGAAGSQPRPLDDALRQRIEGLFDAWSNTGFRVIGVASKPVSATADGFTRDDERDLCLEGFLLFMDPPKDDAAQTVADLARRGVQIKIVTGDNHKVARHVAQAVSLPITGIVTGSQLNEMPEDALIHLAERTTVFAEVDPYQKERIIRALRTSGHVVGYMGDGINDALALHTADVGLSVNTAVDVAKEAADFVLLEKDLSILGEGIDEGRKTFANTLKYILTTISANFGNMFSMAVASIFLPFLPLLASQVLLNNFLSDIPAAAIASDSVDHEWTDRPHRWDTIFIRNYMVMFGLISSIFDLLTFGILLWVFGGAPEVFRTGWFLESLLTELGVALVVRTRRPFYRSRPGKVLLISTLVMMGVALVLPYLPINESLGFVPLPAPLLLTVIGLTLAYMAVVELAKRVFYRRVRAVSA